MHQDDWPRVLCPDTVLAETTPLTWTAVAVNRARDVVRCSASPLVHVNSTKPRVQRMKGVAGSLRPLTTVGDISQGRAGQPLGRARNVSSTPEEVKRRKASALFNSPGSRNTK